MIQFVTFSGKVASASFCLQSLFIELVLHMSDISFTLNNVNDFYNEVEDSSL